MRTLSLCLLFGTILLSACNKSKINLKDNTDLVGEYEWAYSFGADNESESFETTSDKYGIVLKKNGNVKVYSNLVEEKTGFVVESNVNSEGKKELMLILDGEDVFLTFSGNELEWYSYPIENHTNTFQKQ